MEDQDHQSFSDHDLLIRIDEQVRSVCLRFDALQKHHETDVTELKATKVSKSEFLPVKTIAYTIVTLFGSGIVLALLGSIIQ